MNYFGSTHPVASFASSAQLPYRFDEGLHEAYTACINAVTLLN